MIPGETDQQVSRHSQTGDLPGVAPQDGPGQDVLVLHQDLPGLEAAEDGEVLGGDGHAGDGEPHLSPDPAGYPAVPVISQLGLPCPVVPVICLRSN